MARQQTTIGRKIGFGFAVVLVLVAILTGIYQFALSSTTASFIDLVDNNVSIAMHTNTAKIALILCRQSEKMLLYADDQLLTQKSYGYLDEVKNEMGAIETLAKNAGETSLMEAAKKILALGEDYKKAFAGMVGAPVGDERMVATLAVRKAAQALEPELDDLLAAAKKGAEESTVQTVKTATTLGWIALALGAVVMVSGALLAFYLGRGISSTLKQASTSINEGAVQVAGSAGEVFSSSQSLAEGASRQAAAVEEATRELIPGEFLQAAHFNLLMNEEHTRSLHGALDAIARSDGVACKRAQETGNAEFDVTALVLDLQSGDKFLPQPHLPGSKDDLFSPTRELFYTGKPARIQSLSESIMR